MRAFASAVLVLLLLPTSLFAATLTWTGAASAFWSDPGNWSGVRPSDGDDLVFPDTNGNHDMVNDFPSSRIFHSLTFQQTAAAYTLSSNPFFLSGGIDTQSALRSTTISVPIFLTASQTWSTGPAGLNMNAPINLGSSTLTIDADASVTLAQPLNGGGGGLVVGSGTVISQATNTYTGPTTVNANATLLCTGCVIAGSVRLNAGRLVFAQGPGSNTTTPTTGAINSFGGEVDVNATGGRSGSLTLDSFSLYAGNQGTLVVTGTVNLGSAHLSYDAPVIAVYTLIDNDGSDEVIGAFDDLPEGTSFGGRTINYHGGTGNDVTLSTPSPPAPRATTTTLNARPNPVLAGNTITVTATVNATDGLATGGSVTFFEGSAVLGTATVVNGQAVATVGPFVRGNHTLTAVYSSGGSYGGSTSPPLTLVVFLPPTVTATALQVSPNPSAPGQSVTLTATVSSVNGTPPGTVTFFDGNTIIAARTLAGGPVSFTASFALGTHALQAVFVPATVDFEPSASAVVQLTVEPPGRHRAVSH